MQRYEPAWHKSTYSNDTGGDCVEVAESAKSVLVRDTQHRDLGHLSFPANEWAHFLQDLKEDRL